MPTTRRRKKKMKGKKLSCSTERGGSSIGVSIQRQVHITANNTRLLCSRLVGKFREGAESVQRTTITPRRPPGRRRGFPRKTHTHLLAQQVLLHSCLGLAILSRFVFCFGPDEFLSHSSVARQVVDKLGEVAVGCGGGG